MHLNRTAKCRKAGKRRRAHLRSRSGAVVVADASTFWNVSRTGCRPLIGIKDGLAALEVVERIQAPVYKEALPSFDSVAV